MDVTGEQGMAGNAVDGFALDVEPEPEQQRVNTILCIQCGVAIPPNPAAMCGNCIRTQVDISEGIPKNASIYFCRGCERYLNPPTTWIHAELESRDLLALCLKRLRGLNKVRLVDAAFVWTEPHSRRVKVKVTIQKEVLSGAILEQGFVVEYVVEHQFCPECHRQEAADTWNACVQVRQKVKHKKTFFHLEQLIIKHNAHDRTLRIKSVPDGIDFYFNSRSDAKRMVEFLMAVVPCRYKTSERLISSDIQNNNFNYKYTYSVEIVPICKEDVVTLPPALRRQFGGMAPIGICDRVGTSVRIMDPFTLHSADVTSTVFWRHPFRAICSHGGYTEFMVLDIEPVFGPDGRPVQHGKHVLAEATVARERDLGSNDQQFFVRTHLGNILQPGDLVWGFDMTTAVVNDEHTNKLNQDHLPEIVLVKKSYSDRRKKSRKRRFKLRMLPKEDEAVRPDEEDAAMRDLDAFMDDIEEDREYRQNFNLYKNAEYHPSTESEGEDDLHIGVDELLDEFENMDLDDGQAAPDM
ncbi:uncharacterized protein MONBRDRAFT_34439 [Monosiga brevicollis MX1]|uniref:60S ribosomal export protein NMD3 n=1 Tax=Monosiga brevicollis TaxID=81824 RepID=A9VBS7_MONBE|nr:uncharacterized protein MONBRDRAFT_34439 [Monosiga brevicollis MX1]EDQ85029.1 predicted protein [Monosiga brevicollis MX1]|eukprot:XP_001750199.1 hypothetical protein [Monosiga brevicollis MX1]